MRLLAALLLGGASGFLVYFEAALLFADLDGQGPGPGFVAVAFLGGWLVSSAYLLHNARTVSRVCARGALLGAMEWLVMIPAGMVFSAKAVGEVAGDAASSAEIAGAALGGGLMALLTGGAAVGMSLVCMLCFVIAHFMGREMQPELVPPGKPCPECTESIQVDARECRQCGALGVDERARVSRAA